MGALGGMGSELTGDGDDGGMTHDGDDEWRMTRRAPGCSDRRWTSEAGLTVTDGADFSISLQGEVVCQFASNERQTS